MSTELPVRLRIDGENRTALAEPRTLLSDFLREQLGATSVHLGCEHGFCGSCTIVVDGKLTLACTVLAVQADGATVETVTSLENAGELDTVQQCFARHHAVQCGFCTSGMLLAAHDLIETIPDPSEDQIREHMSGNVCRCTGYAGIVAAVADAAQHQNGGK